ncbi:hypothetical protein LWI29_037034 [Acer saccharum]|uniref:Syntaxin-5 N-terminal Sly1p-binding domain-containing protein n=1 Tax=Acer saccharum TaxID=4024 RepID=A0AA39VWD5_ACESA|nr:hypothetical protein LWI29_037034 [Acer saccharum]
MIVQSREKHHNQERGGEVAFCRVNKGSQIPGVGGQCSIGQEKEQSMEDVCEFHGFKQSLSERQLPTAKDRPVGRCDSRARTTEFHGCLLRIQSDPNEQGR